MQILTHTSDNQGQIRKVPISVLLDSGACNDSYISTELTMKLKDCCIEIYPQHQWIGSFEEGTEGVLSSGYVRVKISIFRCTYLTN